MENENQNMTPQDNNQFEGYVAVSFASSSRSYFFGTNDKELNVNDKVVVETVRGLELGTITASFKPINDYSSSLGLKPVLRRATEIDCRMFESNLKDAVFALEICKKEVATLGLDMHLISCEYTLDKAKVIFSYLADERVDFRELLKVLAPKLHTRIDLRQVNSRDKAKMVGGIGMCGLKLCCATFLNEFEGISINRAKNQMLAINVPKLSGHCGKLLCCLKYEDDFYSEAKRDFPEIGTHIVIDKKEWKVSGLNIISQEIRLEGDGDIQTLSLEDYKKQTIPNYQPKRKEEETPEIVFEKIVEANSEKDTNEKRKDRKRFFRHKHHNKNNEKK